MYIYTHTVRCKNCIVVQEVVTYKYSTDLCPCIAPTRRLDEKKNNLSGYALENYLNTFKKIQYIYIIKVKNTAIKDVQLNQSNLNQVLAYLTRLQDVEEGGN